MNNRIELIERMAKGYIPTPQELALLTSCADSTVLARLYQTADEVRKIHCGNAVQVRAIIEFSNYCRCECAYCGLHAGNRQVKRYRMSGEEILAAAKEAVEAGYQTVILQSGEDLSYTAEEIGRLVREIKAMGKVAVTLSCGERPFADYAFWRRCGADRYLIKHEISDPEIYNRYHPHSTFQNRIACQAELYRLGYELGGGFMTGLPGQTPLILANDLLLLQRMKVAMAGIGPYICHGDTALRGSPDGDPALTLRVVALARLLLPDANLPSTTALNVKDGLQNALHCGANVIMQKATPFRYRALYDIYPGRDSKDIPLKEQFAALREQLAVLGRTIYGDKTPLSSKTDGKP